MLKTKESKMFMQEIEVMKQNHKKPLLLLHNIVANDYIAWDIMEERYVLVSGYKTYRDTFYVSKLYGKSVHYKENVEYGITFPSPTLIEILELSINPFIASHKMAWDIWEPRPIKICPLDEVPAQFWTDYFIAADIINKARTKDIGNDKIMEQLERRMYRFERMCFFHAPVGILEQEMELINRISYNF